MAYLPKMRVMAYPYACRSRALLIPHTDRRGTWPGIREVHDRYIPGPSARSVKPPADPTPSPPPAT